MIITQENTLQTDFVTKLLEAVISYKHPNAFVRKPITPFNQQICAGIASETRQHEIKSQAEETAGHQPQSTGKTRQRYGELGPKRLKLLNDRQKKLDKALDAIGDVLTETAAEIAAELESRDEFDSASGHRKYIVRTLYKGQPCQRKYSRGMRTEEFDFRNYVWITVMDANDDQRQWMLTLHFNDIDNDRDFEFNSGNPHTQFGRIQFWRDININEGTCNSPNKVISKDGGNIVLEFCGEKSSDPGQSIYDGTYNPITLVDSFIKFLRIEKRI